MKTTTIKSVLSNLSALIDDRYWNESIVLEHASRGFLQINLNAKFEDAVTSVTITDYKGELPEDLKFIQQVVYKEDTKTQVMRLSTNSFRTDVCTGNCLMQCPDCKYEYSIGSSGVITTNFKDGEVLISYLRVPQDEDGYLLIPDDETLKEALTHYVLYMYWLTKDLMKEEGASQRMAFHLRMWSTLSKKAMNLNLPTVDQLENLKNTNQRLVPNSRMHDSLFSKLNNNES